MKDTLPKCLGKDHTDFLNIYIFFKCLQSDFDESYKCIELSSQLLRSCFAESAVNGVLFKKCFGSKSESSFC